MTAHMIPIIIDMLRRPDTNKVLATVNPDGSPHARVCGTLLVSDEGNIVVGEVYMQATRRNLERDPRAEFLVWSGRDGYSIQTVAKYRSESGPLLDKMNKNLEKMRMKAVAVWEFEVLSTIDEGIRPNHGTPVPLSEETNDV